MTDPRPAEQATPRAAQRALVLLRAECAPGSGDDMAARMRPLLAADRGDGVLLEVPDDARGLFTLLAEAVHQRRPVLPARWLAARPLAHGAPGDSARLLWVARSDRALASLLADAGLGFDERPGRHDEPVALLGVDGDPVAGAAGDSRDDVRQRAELWIQRVGIDHVALALPFGSLSDDPMLQLAGARRIPVVALASPSELADLPRAGTQSAPPWLSTDFQLDREHRLPDEAYVPGLRDLLHRGSLLRERTLFERLPQAWRTALDTELRALYAWHVSPLLRRAATLLQTLAPLPSVRVRAPLPQLEGVCAWLLGLTDRRPADPPACANAQETARALASGLQAWDRCVAVDVDASVWPRAAGRLMPWIDAGMLAACPEAPAQPGRRFCFSGEPLWSRAPLRRDRDGVPAVTVEAPDRRALGWFELELHAREALLLSIAPPAGARFVAEASRCEEQLDLGLEGWGT